MVPLSSTLCHFLWFGGLTEIGPHSVLWWDRTPAGLSRGYSSALHPSLPNFPIASPTSNLLLLLLSITSNNNGRHARTSSSIRRQTKRPIWAIFSKEWTDRLLTGHTFKRDRETQWARIAEKQILSTSADFKRQSDGRDYLGSKDAALHTTQEKGPKELSVIPFMFVFTGNPEHSFLFFYAKESKHGTLCRLMKLNSSEQNGQSFLFLLFQN